jgi:hypothetical protein
MHDGQEEVVVDPDLVVELIGSQSLGDRIESLVSEVLADEGGVLLLDKAIVVLAPGVTAGEVNRGDLIVPESLGVMIEQGRVVVGVHFNDGEGDATEDKAESILNDTITTSQDGHQFAPASGYIDHLEGV